MKSKQDPECRKANKLGLLVYQANKENKLEEDMHARFKK
jgi:hypothetical protein